MIPWNYKNREAILDTEEVGGVPYLSFRARRKQGWWRMGFLHDWAASAKGTVLR